MIAFEDGRVGLHIPSYSKVSTTAEQSYSKIKAFANGMITDLFFGGTETSVTPKSKFDDCRTNGLGLRPQLRWVPGYADPKADAGACSKAIGDTGTGVCDLDIEEGTDAGFGVDYAAWLTAFLDELRAKRPTFLLRLDVAPNKGGFLPLQRIAADPYLYLTVQNYFGDMSPVQTDWLLRDCQVGTVVPPHKFSITYGATDSSRIECTLPIFYQGGVVTHLRGGAAIWSSDLLEEVREI